MAKDPAFLFYPGDFNTGTQFFSDDQVGKYMRLLMAQHQHGHLTEDQVIFICKSYDKHIMSKFIKDSFGLWFNERLEFEMKKRKNYTESRSKNKEGKTKEKNISKSYDLHMENRNENEIINEDNYIMVEDKKVFDPLPIIEFYAIQFNGTKSENGNIAWLPLVNPWFLEHIGEDFKDGLHAKNSFKKYYINKLKNNGARTGSKSTNPKTSTRFSGTGYDERL